MRKITIFTIITAVALSFAAYLKDIPVTIFQPDGTEIECFSTGDEFFNRLHDSNDFTIIQGQDGWYYYGERSGEEVVPSPYIAGKTDPGSADLEKGVKISAKLYRERVKAFNSFDVPKDKDIPTTGTINNIVIFIRFSDEAEAIFNDKRSYYDNFFSRQDGSSLNHYFDEVSHQQLEVLSTYYPHVDDFNTNLSFQDIYPRSYYQPYNATTNPDGYQGGDHGAERTEREQSLLERAVLAVADQVPADLNIDINGDDYIDSVVFLISGSPGAWASLLWPHKWTLYTRNVEINRKRVWDYNFNLTGSSTYFNVGVIAHEFFHTLGAPDLYRYYDNTISPVGPWDIMSNTTSTPQYMGAWMKYKYGKWITPPTLISQTGEYTINPLQSSVQNMYRINSPNSTNEFFLVEYRKQSGIYETNLPGSADGLLIYRMDSRYNGNADGPPDEVYVFRPNGTPSLSGQINNAQYSTGLGRTEFNLTSNPVPFLADGSPGGINIYDIGVAGETITFKLGINVLPPTNLIAGTGYGSIKLNWNEPDSVYGASVSYYRVYRNGLLIADNLIQTSFSDENVEEITSYKYSVSAYYEGDVSGESSFIETDEMFYSPPRAVPYSTDFSNSPEWSQSSVNSTPRWSLSNTSLAGGSSPEMKADIENANPAISRLISPVLSTSGIDTLEISFKHFYDSYDIGVDYKLSISSDKFNWTDTYWSFAGTSSSVPPAHITIELTEFPDPLYVAWTLEGHFWSYDGWYIDDVSVARKGESSIEDGTVPSATRLYGNYPNPFNPETTIRFDLEKNGEVHLAIYDIKGSLVKTLSEGEMRKGSHSIKWDGRNDYGAALSSGIYYINLSAGGRTFTGKALMIK